ncbi:MAG: hypothetical protein Q8O63_14515, partial [Hoeflea sp.]|nr:hypothetical protein [Hoeflea sp.]
PNPFARPEWPMSRSGHKFHALSLASKRKLSACDMGPPSSQHGVGMGSTLRPASAGRFARGRPSDVLLKFEWKAVKHAYHGGPLAAGAPLAGIAGNFRETEHGRISCSVLTSLTGLTTASLRCMIQSNEMN